MITVLTSSFAMAQTEPIYSISSTQFYQNKISSSTEPSPQEKVVAVKKAQSMRQKDIMIISPKSRTHDLLSAFQFLKKMSPATKVGVRLTDGSVISEILDMDVMPEGTMIIFKINTLKGQKFKIVNIENIEALINI